LDGVHDTANMPLAEEPQRIRDDLEAVVTHQADPSSGEPSTGRAE
jgi:hypothetical protein